MANGERPSYNSSFFEEGIADVCIWLDCQRIGGYALALAFLARADYL